MPLANSTIVLDTLLIFVSISAVFSLMPAMLNI